MSKQKQKDVDSDEDMVELFKANDVILLELVKTVKKILENTIIEENIKDIGELRKQILLTDIKNQGTKIQLIETTLAKLV